MLPSVLSALTTGEWIVAPLSGLLYFGVTSQHSRSAFGIDILAVRRRQSGFAPAFKFLGQLPVRIVEKRPFEVALVGHRIRQLPSNRGRSFATNAW